MNEIKLGVRSTAPEKPDELVVYELIKSTGLPLFTGGLIDQPHIWMLQWEIVDGVVRTFDALDEMEKKAQERQQLNQLLSSQRR